MQPSKSDEGIWAALREGSRFFAGDSKVDHALEELDGSVREKFRELWQAAQGVDPD